jgi:hypothetical protein
MVRGVAVSAMPAADTASLKREVDELPRRPPLTNIRGENRSGKTGKDGRA